MKHTCNNQEVPTLTAPQSPLVMSLLKQKNALLKAIRVLPEGHIHVVIPQQIKQNIQNMKLAFSPYNIKPQMLLSHKPTKSNALIKQACAEGTNLDVSSKNELISALKNGFIGSNVCCTGSKNDEYMALSIQHSCLHSIDSIEELQHYIALHQAIVPNQKRDILLRINSANIPENEKISRFGIIKTDIDKCFQILKENKQINLKGFHVHSGESSPELRSWEIIHLIELMQKSYALGFSPNIIDIGGTLPKKGFEDAEECDNFTQSLIDQMMQKVKPFTWRGYSYGLEMASNGSVLGQEVFKSMFKAESLNTFAQKLLSIEDKQSREIHNVINECGFSLAIEPGAAAYDQCGFMLFKVVGTRYNNDGEHMTILDGNIFNLSLQIIEYLSDPILLSETDDLAEPDESFSTFLVGNLCADFDVMVKRKVVLSATPKAGDYLCFLNTAGYTADFHDAPVHQHPMGQKIVAIKHENTWEFTSEDRFNPYLEYRK